MTAGGVSIHVVDARDGLPAEGLRVDVYRRTDDGGRAAIAGGHIGRNALLADPRLEARQRLGGYEVHFQAGDYFERHRSGGELPSLVDIVVFAFEIEDASRHIHLPLKMTPCGYSLFKGDP